MNQPETPVIRESASRSPDSEEKRSAKSFPLLVAVMLFLGVSALVIILFPLLLGGRMMMDGIAVGRIADKDIIAPREIVAEDVRATEIRRQAEELLVLPVFIFDPGKAQAAMDRFSGFATLLESLVGTGMPRDTLYFTVQRAFPGILDRDTLHQLVNSPLLPRVLANVAAVLERIMERGIAAMPGPVLDRYNPDYLQMRRLVETRVVVEELPFSRLVTGSTLASAIEDEMAARYVTRLVAGYVGTLVEAFAVQNIFFDESQSEKSREKALRAVQPVYIRISKGEPLLRKGSLIDEDTYAKLLALRDASRRQNWNLIILQIGLLAFAVFLALNVFGDRFSLATLLGIRGIFLTTGFSFLFFIGAFTLLKLGPPEYPLLAARYIPTAFPAMVMSVLAGPAAGVQYSLILAILVASASGGSGILTLLILFSALGAVFVTRAAFTRIELLRAALLQSLVQAVLSLLFTVGQGSNAGSTTLLQPVFTVAYGYVPGGLPGILLIHASNGLLCGILAMAILPLIEEYLNVPTRFRLMELSDLNSPTLKRLQSVAPGTYSHSIAVANFAETACRAIGADPLIARVGAYYHDIGKMEQPEYFIENQSGYNKHEELNPRLSATVIRSHVKIGAEKARTLHLPTQVVDIIAQHHGTSIIAWFFDQAKKIDPAAREEDFCYTADLPVSRESSIVMLADAVEAASRTLAKPNGPRLDQFVREIIAGKSAAGQLDKSELTFSDLEKVRAAFMRILAGHFHSRIEYPKSREQER